MVDRGCRPRPSPGNLKVAMDIVCNHSYLVMLMRLFGEFMSSALMMCLGCLACSNGGANPLNASLVSGFLVTATLHSFGFVSGGHANPCVTFACYILGFVSMKICILYSVMQFLGSLFGFFLLTIVLPESNVYGNKLCLTAPVGVSTGQAFLIEFILTATLIFGWCAVWDMRNTRFLDSISLRMGSLTAACVLAGFHLTGASMNPFKSMVPAIFHKSHDHIFLYTAGHFGGTLFATYSWMYLFSSFRIMVEVKS